MTTLKFKNKWIDEECDVLIVAGRYSNNAKALRIFDAEDGSPILVATVNIPDEKLIGDEIIIKNWSENEGVLEWLQANNIVGPTKREIYTGFVKAQVVDLLATELFA